MRILAIDIGTGTQNNLPFDADQTVENSAQLVIPAPTVIALQRVQAATTASSPPPSSHRHQHSEGSIILAAQDHIVASFSVYTTPTAAVTFDDGLDMVQKM